MILYIFAFYGLLILLLRAFIATNTAKNTGDKSKNLFSIGWQIGLLALIGVLALFGEAREVAAWVFMLIVGCITWIKKPKSTTSNLPDDMVTRAAKSYLNRYKEVRTMYPNLKQADLYEKVAESMSKPGFSTDAFLMLMGTASNLRVSLSSMGMYSQPAVNFQVLVLTMIMQELDSKGQNHSAEDIWNRVNKVIPRDL